MEFDIDIHTGLNGKITIEDYSQEYMELNIYNPLFRYLTVENSPLQVQIDLRKILI